ncbi:hypothetical protein H7170_04140 [Candidatus Gracilibacteria bacterium]|nr:hypothetical protein [Candidatus Gracilibacteria bacterium]
MKKIIFPIIIIGLTSCTMNSDISQKEIEANIGTQKTITGNLIPSQSEETVTRLDSKDEGKNYKEYKNTAHNISFQYPMTMTAETHSGIVSWDENMKINQMENYVLLKDGSGSISVKMPGDTVHIGGAPLFGVNEEAILIGDKEVIKRVEFGSQDSTGPNQEGTWVLKYTFTVNGKTFIVSSFVESIFSKYNITKEIDDAMVNIVATFR